MSFKTRIVNAGAAAMRCLPARPSIAALASAYLDAYNGDNNMDPIQNGEWALAEALSAQSKLIFDVGANVGNWSIQVARANPCVRIHAFEPSGSTFRELNERTEPCRTQIKAVNVGLGAANTQETMTLYSGASELGSLHRLEGAAFDPLGSPEFDVVSVVTLDSYCTNEGISAIDFVKVDVEGHEFKVLEGAKSMLFNGSIRYLQFEYHATWIYSCTHLRDVFELLSSTPYRVFKILGPHRFLSVPRYSQALETHQYSNYLLVAEGNDLPGSVVKRTFQV